MVFKPSFSVFHNNTRFENDVKMYGIQTQKKSRTIQSWFENDVKMYGIQTPCGT